MLYNMSFSDIYFILFNLNCLVGSWVILREICVVLLWLIIMLINGKFFRMFVFVFEI